MKQGPIYQKKLDQLRKKIDKLDSRTLELLSQRFEIVYQVGLLKKEHGKEICDSKREEEVLKRLIEENHGKKSKLTAEHVHAIYYAIMFCAKNAEKEVAQKN